MSGSERKGLSAVFEWIAQNALTLAAGAAVLAVISGAVISLVRDRKRRGGGCSGDCASCGMCCRCGNVDNPCPYGGTEEAGRAESGSATDPDPGPGSDR